jgi:predicted component of type VI protein secretion system
LEEKIKNIIQKYEPRVKVKQIDVKPDVDSNAISVNVEYFVSGSRTQDLLLTLERTR